MGEKSILQFAENVLNFDVVVSIKDIIAVATVYVVFVQKVNKYLFVVANSIDVIGNEFGSQDDIFAYMPLLKSAHESKNLLQGKNSLPIANKRVPFKTVSND